jgi:hypothetical protein
LKLLASDFVPGQVGNALAFVREGFLVTFPVDSGSHQNIDLNQGEAELWYCPDYDSTTITNPRTILFRVAIDASNPPALELGAGTNLLHMRRPVIYGYSQVALPRPVEWNTHIHITGFWFLDQQSRWQPPPDLVQFLAAGAPPVYLGFGSTRDRDPDQVGRVVLEALQKSGQRGILLSGWGGLKTHQLPDTVFLLESVPYDWLFPQMAAIVHHGGIGTTSAALFAFSCN